MGVYDIITSNTFHITMKQFRENKTEGFAILGAGGDLNEWIEGITGLIHEEGIWPTANPHDYFSEFYSVKSYTDSDATVLCMVFKEDSELNLPKLSLWRLRNTSQYNIMWIADLAEKVGD